MNETPRLAQKEWILIFIFLAILVSLVCIAYLSDVQVDQEIERYLDPKGSKQTF